MDHVEAADAHLLRPKAVRWVWRELIPAGMLSLIAGVPGSSKSVLAALIAAEVSRGGGQVVKSNLEDPREEVQIPRLLAARADMRGSSRARRRTARRARASWSCSSRTSTGGGRRRSGRRTACLLASPACRARPTWRRPQLDTGTPDEPYVTEPLEDPFREPVPVEVPEAEPVRA